MDEKMVGWFDYKTCPGVDPSSQSSKKVSKFFSIWQQYQNSTTCQNNMMHTCFKAKRELECQNELFFEISFLWKYWDYLTNIWCNNWQSTTDVIKNLGYRSGWLNVGV